MHKIDTTSAEHYSWGTQCDGWHLLKHADLGVIEERMPPGTREQCHLHLRVRQFFYVLTGSAMLELDGQRLELAAGQGAHVPPRYRPPDVQRKRQRCAFSGRLHTTWSW